MNSYVQLPPNDFKTESLNFEQNFKDETEKFKQELQEPRMFTLT